MQALPRDSISACFSRVPALARNLLVQPDRIVFLGGGMKVHHWLLLAAMLAPMAHAQDASQVQSPVTKDGASGEKGDAASGAPSPKRRLKFKGDRPTCTCVSALGEAAILAAEEKKNSPPSQPSKRSEK